MKLPCKLSPELDEIRPKRVFKSYTSIFLVIITLVAAPKMMSTGPNSFSAAC